LRRQASKLHVAAEDPHRMNPSYLADKAIRRVRPRLPQSPACESRDSISVIAGCLQHHSIIPLA
jgi:hypothetical protein